MIYHKHFGELAAMLTIVAMVFALCVAFLVMWKLYHDAEKKRRVLHTALEKLVADIQSAPVNSGVCCCGEDMDSHDPYFSNHSPVDSWDHYVINYSKNISSILEQTK